MNISTVLCAASSNDNNRRHRPVEPTIPFLGYLTPNEAINRLKKSGNWPYNKTIRPDRAPFSLTLLCAFAGRSERLFNAYANQFQYGNN